MSNRIFKFRVWHKELNKFLPYEEYFIDFEGDLRFYDLGFETFETVNKELYIIQQYTGYNDINNKEIYEGDVLQWRELIDWSGNIPVISGKWHEYFGEVNWIKDRYLIYTGLNNGYSLDNKEYKVVGNIFER